MTNRGFQSFSIKYNPLWKKLQLVAANNANIDKYVVKNKNQMDAMSKWKVTFATYILLYLPVLA